jgi:HD-GYP domain-containing protein (c-di-GMP phosphodiesterase class II)
MEAMSDKIVTTEKKQFCHVPIKIIVYYGNAVPFEIFLKLSDNKMVRISNKEEDVKETVVKYLNKGIKEVFANADDYNFFLEKINAELSNKFFSAETTYAERLEIMQMGIDLLKVAFMRVGPKESAFKLANSLSKRTTELVKTQSNIDELYAKYKLSCHHEFIKAMFISTCVVAMIETFDWQTDQAKERAVQSVLLRDICMSLEDINTLQKHTGPAEKLREDIFNHPLLIAKILNPENSTKMFAQDVITVIEQHHERPDGKGFPGKLDHKRIILLSAIHIVADCYIEEMIKVAFNPEKKIEVLEVLRDEFKKGNYRKAFDALETVLKK